MKIAIPTNGKMVSSHFGHCTNFQIFEIENNQVSSQSTIENPRNHKPGVLPRLLIDNGINLVIAGGIGQKAIDLFNQASIKVITGANGFIEETLKRFLDGSLRDGENTCSH